MKITQLTFEQLPKTYEALCRFHLPRPIHDRVGLENATEIIDALAGHRLNAEQTDYLDLLSDLVADYEDEREPLTVGKMPSAEALHYLMEQSATSVGQLAEILEVDRSLVNKILRGERRLTVGHINKLADRFTVSGEIFLQAADGGV